MKKFLLLFSLFLSCIAMADGPFAARPDSHAPIGVMGEHTHKAGEFMFSYRRMYMEMDGNRDGTDRLSKDDVIGEGYTVAPLEMEMVMDMFGFMYAPSDDLTLMLMVPWIQLSMDHWHNGMSKEFSTDSEGLGDISISGLYSLKHDDHHRIHLNIGFSLPTGDIDESDYTVMPNPVTLPYPMQLGSGSYGFMPGLTYSGNNENYSWGGQGIFTFYLNDNDEDYRLGDRFKLTGWAARKVSDSLSLSGRLEANFWDDINGEDDRLNKNMVPTADPDLRGGSRLDAHIGLNYKFVSGILKGHRIALEFGAPIYQDLNGPQLETDIIATIGWQFAW